ncbi:MAG: peptidoglycan recognition family protein [Cyanobacteriota bacterium]
MKSKLAICLIILMSFFTTNIFYANSNEINIFEKEPKIISRKEWKAKLPIKKMITHEPKIITIHHSGIFSAKKINIFEKMQNLQKYSQSSEKMQNGKIKEVWADVPYHFVISGTGEIAEGREINFSGDTNTEYNPENHILIDVLGNFEEQIPTEEQINSLIHLCYYLAKKYNISVEKINAHNYYAKTDCPGKNLSKIIPQIKTKLSL